MSTADNRPVLMPVADVPSRTDQIVYELRRAVLRGDLQPGQPLVERDLANRLGVSKTPVREALKVLARSGLVTATPYRGAQVRAVSAELARSLYGVRILLEPEAVRLAGASTKKDWIRDARGVLQEAHAAGKRSDFPSLSQLNRQFHRLIYAHSGNEVLTALLDDLQDQVALISTFAWRRRLTWASEAEDHTAILDALETGNADHAAQLAKQHIHSSLSRLSEVFSELGEENGSAHPSASRIRA